MRSKICGITLNRLALFIGVIYLLQSIIVTTGLIFNLIRYQEDKERAKEDSVPYDEDREIVSALSVSISLSLTFVLTTPLLIWGSIKEKYLFLVPWLYNSMICIIINCLYLFVTLMKNLYDRDKTNNELQTFILITFMMIVGLTLQIIFYRIVYKLYKELLHEWQLSKLDNSNLIFIVYEEPPDTTDQR